MRVRDSTCCSTLPGKHTASTACLTVCLNKHHPCVSPPLMWPLGDTDTAITCTQAQLPPAVHHAVGTTQQGVPNVLPSAKAQGVRHSDLHVSTYVSQPPTTPPVAHSQDADMNDLLPFGEYVAPSNTPTLNSGLLIGIESWELEHILRLAAQSGGRPSVATVLAARQHARTRMMGGGSFAVARIIMINNTFESILINTGRRGAPSASVAIAHPLLHRSPRRAAGHDGQHPKPSPRAGESHAPPSATDVSSSSSAFGTTGIPRSSSAAWSGHTESTEAHAASVDVSIASGSPSSTDPGWDVRPDRASSKGFLGRCKVGVCWVEQQRDVYRRKMRCSCMQLHVCTPTSSASPSSTSHTGIL